MEYCHVVNDVDYDVVKHVNWHERGQHWYVDAVLSF